MTSKKACTLFLVVLLFMLSACSGEKKIIDVSGLTKENSYFDFENDTFYDRYYDNGTLVKEFVIENSSIKEVKTYDRSGIDFYKEYVYASDACEGEYSSYNTHYVSSSGNITKTIIGDRDGNTLETINYTYDEKDNLIKRDMLGSIGVRTACFEYSYNNYGKLLKRYEYDEKTKLAEILEFFYNDDGDCIKKEYLDSGSNLIKTVEYEYAETGKPSKITTVTAEGVTESEVVFEYDDNMNLILK